MASRIAHISTKIVIIAWRNVWRNWRHSLSTIIAIALGFMAVSLFDGFLRELTNRTVDGYAVRGMLGDVLVQKEGAQEFSAEDPWKYSLDSEQQTFLEDFLAKDPAVVERVRFLNTAGLASVDANNGIFWGFGYDIEAGAKVRGERWLWDVTAGKPLHMSSKQSVILAVGLGEVLGCDPTSSEEFVLPDGNYVAAQRPYKCKNDRIMLTATTEAAQVNAIQVNVTGLFDAGFREANKRHIRLSLEDAQTLLDTDKISLVSVQLKQSEMTDDFIKRLTVASQKQGIELEITPWIDHNVVSFVKGGFDILEVFRNLFMVIVITIVVMSVANTMMKAVNERVREIGTLRSIGYLKRQLVMMFAWEGFFTSFIACALGLLLTVLVSGIIDQLGITYKAGILSIPLPLKVAPAPSAWLISFVALSLLATLTAWFCSRRACNMTIADAMRHV